MAGGTASAAPDVQPENQSQLDGQSCVDYAHDRAKEYAAALHFIGLLAGIGDDASDIKAARDLVREALSEVIKSGGPSEDDKFQKDYRDAQQARDEASRAFGEALTRNRSAIGDARDAAEASGTQIPSSLADWLASEPNVPVDMRSAAQNVVSAEQKFDVWRGKDAERTKRARQSLSDDLDSLWAGLKKKYHEAIAAIDNGTWKTGLCKLGVDAGFLIVETAIGVALSAVLTPAVAAAMKVVSRVVEKGSALVRIGIKATRLKLEHATEKAIADKTFKRTIDTSKELTAAEKKVLGPENQGTTKATPDAGNAEAKGAQKTEQQAKREKAAENPAKGKQGEEHYNEKNGGRSLQNGRGNGIDNVKENKDGSIVFSEVKTSDKGIIPLDGAENLGGKDFVRSRLEEMAAGGGGYSADTAAYANGLLRKIDSGAPVSYQKVNLKRNPDGTFTQLGVEPWERKWSDAQNLKWREARKRRRAKPKANATPNTQTGPPGMGPR
jgi:hypothetical protein